MYTGENRNHPAKDSILRVDQIRDRKSISVPLEPKHHSDLFKVQPRRLTDATLFISVKSSIIIIENLILT